MAVSKPVTDLTFLLCPLCTETLKSPKILPCLHTLCKQCIHEHITNLRRSKDDKLTEFSCPVCRTVVKPNTDEPESKWASTLHTNSIISSMIATSNGNNERNCEPCKRHQQSAVANFWCKDCLEAFCEDCNAKHSWLKFKIHTVVTLKDIGLDTSGIDLSAISEKCPTHPNKAMESFCYDHKQLCCISCMTLDHRMCSSVQAVEDIVESTEINTQLDSLNGIKEEAAKLLKAKEAELEKVEALINDTEEDAEKFIKSQKCKLDQLFESFTKQLRTLRDEQEAGIQVSITLLKQLLSNLEHGLTTADVVNTSGSKTQLLIYLKNIETQLASRIRELQKVIGNDRLEKTTFEKHDILQQLNVIETIGTIAVSKDNAAGQMQQMLKSSSPLWWKAYPVFDTLRIEKVKTINIPGSDLRCGVCVNGEQMIVGDKNVYVDDELHLCDKESGTIISSMELSGSAIRLCYLSQENQICISCSSQKLFCALLDGENIKSPVKVGCSSYYFGGLQSFDEHVYIITDRVIRTFPTTANPKYLTEIDSCFETNTECGLNSLGIHDAELVFTTEDCEVKRTTLDGKVVYCFKDESIKTPECIVVLPTGMVLVVDRAKIGSLHLLSEDGKKSKILLDKFESIKDPQDIWLDLDGETFYVAGGEYIEVFRVI